MNSTGARSFDPALFPAYDSPVTKPMAKAKRQFDVVIEKDSAGYLVAWVPALPGCHTQARSHDELTKRIREAIELCLGVGVSGLRPFPHGAD